MSRPPRHYLVCYDICDARRLRAVYRCMRGFGEHTQYSVFLCHLSEARRVELATRLHDLIHHDEDQVLIVDLGPEADARFTAVGLSLDRPQEGIRVV